mgnify:FL=1
MTTVVEPPDSRFVPRKRTPLTVDFDMDYNGGADGFVYGNDATAQRLSLLVADDELSLFANPRERTETFRERLFDPMIADDARLVQCLQVIADKLRKHEPHIVLDVRSCSLIKSPEHSGIDAVRLVFFDASSGATESATFQV